MGENTKIEWADHTWNPWTGCTKVSPGCDHCYAEGWAKRSGAVKWGAGEPRRRTTPANWRMPLKWNAQAAVAAAGWAEGVKLYGSEDAAIAAGHIKPRRPRVFCSSLADVFDNAVDIEWRADLFGLILNTPHLDWLLLTKRIGNVERMLQDLRHGADHDLPLLDMMPLPNVWLGATVVNQAEADRDIPKLLAVPARVRFLSIEPMLGPIDVRRFMWPVHPRWPAGFGSPEAAIAAGAKVTYHRQGLISAKWADHLLSWVICGGESGPGARPMHPDWARCLRDQCAAAGVAFMMKQMGGVRDKRGALDDLPEDLRVREFPR